MVAQTLQKAGTLNRNLLHEINKAETLNRAKENEIGDGGETKTTKREFEAISKSKNICLSRKYLAPIVTDTREN